MLFVIICLKPIFYKISISTRYKYMDGAVKTLLCQHSKKKLLLNYWYSNLRICLNKTLFSFVVYMFVHFSILLHLRFKKSDTKYTLTRTAIGKPAHHRWGCGGGGGKIGDLRWPGLARKFKASQSSAWTRCFFFSSAVFVIDGKQRLFCSSMKTAFLGSISHKKRAKSRPYTKL